MLQDRYVYGRVRLASEGYEFVLTRNLAGSVEVAEWEANRSDAEAPDWARSNPQVRTGRFLIREVSMQEGGQHANHVLSHVR